MALTLRKALLSLLVVGIAGAIAGYGVFSAFSSTTSNSGNNFTAGTVIISATNVGTAAYSISAAKPGDTSSRCFQVSYTGSLPANVHLYRTSQTAGTGLDQYVDLQVIKGTGTQANCSDFTAAATSPNVFGVSPANTLNNFPTTFAAGLALTNASGSTTWNNGDSVTYKVQGTLNNNNSAQGLSTGNHTFVWEAQNT